MCVCMGELSIDGLLGPAQCPAMEEVPDPSLRDDAEAPELAEGSPPGQEPEKGEGEGEQPERLMITRIVCTNFKSYAGVKELGPFHKVRRRSYQLAS